MTRPVEPVGPRDRIVAAALSVFAERGVAAGSIQQVAEAAGMSKQALMHHFPSKAHLRDGVYGLLAVRLRGAFPAVAGELVSRSTDRYRGVVADVFGRLCANPEIARFVVFELLEDPAHLVAWVRAETAPWIGLLRGVAEQWPSEGGVTEDVEAVAVSMAVSMLAHSALVPRTDEDLRPRVERAALSLLLRGSRL